MTETSSLFTIPMWDLLNQVVPRKYRITRESSPHYCPPGAGHWGMVKMAFLVPEISVLFVIPMGCGRHGGIATMREGLVGDLSYLPIAEVDIVTGNHLNKVEEAVAEIVQAEAPKGLMIFTTCIDDLLGSDYDSLISLLSERHALPIVQGKMNPIMALSKKPPGMMIYNSIHGFLKKEPHTKGLLNVLGTPRPIDPDSEIHRIMKDLGLMPLQHIGKYRDFESHLAMGKAEGNLVIALPGLRAAENLQKRLGQSFLPMYSVFRPQGISRNYQALAQYLGEPIDTTGYQEDLDCFLAEHTQSLAGKTAAIGTTLQAAPFELARFLTEMGMEVRYIIAGFIRPYEREHIPWLEEHAPEIRVIPSLEPSLSTTLELAEHVDYGFGLDIPAHFKIDRLIDISVEDNLFGYEGTRKLVRQILEAPEYDMTIKELVYSQNLVV